jgi:hypothetical protein
MDIDGHCHCGNISFKGNIDSTGLTICHCADCQSLSGSPFRASIPIEASKFSLHGVPKLYVKVAESGAKRVQAFCECCGSPIYSSALENPQTYSLRLGLVTQRASLTPRQQIWKSSALPWIDHLFAIAAAAKEE